jgi:type I restriction enzyme S subunit
LRSYPLSRDVETKEVTGYRYIHYGDIHKQVADIVTHDEQLPSIKSGNYILIKQGDLVLADASEDYIGIAEPCVILHEPKEKIVAGLHTIAIRPIKANSMYLYYLLHTEEFKKYGSYVGTGLKVFGITFSNLANYETKMPNEAEQTAIGNFFRVLDNTIETCKHKLSDLRKLKKAYLQQMFLQEGESVPKMRFAGFSGDWEVQKLGEYFTERSERSGNGELISVTINYGVMKASKLDRQIISSEDKSNYKTVKIGDIAYNSMRMWQGASGYSPYDGILSPAYTVITPKKNAYSLFFACFFKRMDMIQIFQKNSQGLTSDTWNLKFPAFSQIEVRIPLFEEQRSIANFFGILDRVIAVQSQKLEQLKELKSAYLQKMFV